MRSLAAALALSVALVRTLGLDGAPTPAAAPHAGPLTPEEQVSTFSLPPGFRIELVVAEPDGGKFVALSFDHAGRLWTTTALEYPIDANESPAEAKALFARGGRDRVLVVDHPGAPGRQPVRTFAEGLAICLGVLPHRNGAFVQYGSEVRFYRDSDADGRADGFETVLSGFGIEDSHLFPHQFTRVPGGVLLAQGAFNFSQVRTRAGKVVPFNRTKLARFPTDGSDFEIVGWGPCNIWGLTQDRLGQVWIQEANDTGWPMMPFLEGASYPLCGDDVPKPYAPSFPKTGVQPMGGTGLSGLALSEGADAFPGDWRNVFFIANPITRKIQAMRARGSAGSWEFESLPDFALSSDPMFRPVAMALGPDGCLYVVDWYNAIISHNEVPRGHADRDKSRGRIWRIRHESQPHRLEFPDLYRAGDEALVAALRATNSVEANAAWQEIADRGARHLVPALTSRVADKGEALDVRHRGLWALGELDSASPELLTQLLAESAMRLEALRQVRRRKPEASLDRIAWEAATDFNPLVQEEVLRLLASRLRSAVATGTDLESQFGILSRIALIGGTSVPEWMPQGTATWQGYHRAFGGFLARQALEGEPALVAHWLDRSPDAPPEARAFACLALGGRAGAVRLAALGAALGRPVRSSEMLMLASAAEEPTVSALLSRNLGDPAHLQRIHENRAQLAGLPALVPLLTDGLRDLVRRMPTAANRDLLGRLASGFRLTALAPELADIAESPGSTVEQQQTALRALRETATPRVDLFRRFARSGDDRVRQEAIAALSALKSAEATTALMELWPDLSPSLRRQALQRLSGNPVGAKALLAAIQSGAIGREELDGAVLDLLASVLPMDPGVVALQEQVGTSLRPILRLDGNEADFLDLPLDLAGPFTVETWIRLDPGINNQDSVLAGRDFDLNFHDARFRAWIGAGGDIVSASRPVFPETWTHVALTRDAQGFFRLYLNGELDRTSAVAEPRTFQAVRPGFSSAAGGTGAEFAEYRIWDQARSAAEIRSGANRSLPVSTAGLRFHGTGSQWTGLHGKARVERTADGPPVMSEAEASSQETQFTKYRTLGTGTGDPKRGRERFTSVCAPCHTVRGEGGRIGPVLDGAGASGLEALLRNVLMPDAAMEAGYRRFRVETLEGDTLEGLLAAQDADSVTLRQPNTEDQRILRKNLRRAGFVRGSVMPGGLLEALPDSQAADLLAYLQTLK